MKMNSSKKMFFTMMIMSTMMVMSSENWISMWMGLEINMMMFIPLMMKSKNKKSPESKMMYFLIQSMSSMVFLMTIIANPMMMYSEMTSEMMKMIMVASIAMKMGAAPFHMWFTEIITKMSWNNSMILMTWQKIAPMSIMTMIYQEKMITMIAIISTMIGAIGGINQTSIQKIMAFSSINHMGWMLIILNSESEIWLKYLMLYSIMVIMIMKSMEKKSIQFMNQIQSICKNKMEKMNIMIMMMSLGGMPPMMGFLPKWMAIQSMMNKKMMLIMMIMIMMSMITLYYYLRMMTPMMIINTESNKIMIKKSKNEENKMIIMLNLMLPAMMIMNMF
uniref:NADH dehydrogenase subunit 2 n=1 Tax=Hermatobates djiboutensis TaxID=301294 RepID=UPI002E7889CA|nr:NADH dehydrogenase subunit 2 [Hermatobates djiboutensis]WPW46684.1 NADH dehydrogenase subunit 2 [Hermatobates djiboutensis]